MKKNQILFHDGSLKKKSATWQDSASDYRELIASRNRDSRVLRELGLIPMVVEMVGDCRDSVLLDAGTGTGWLFEQVKPAEAYACDIVQPDSLPDFVQFDLQNVGSLKYPDDTFDIIVTSLLLIFHEDLRQACQELFRVSKPDGRLIIALVTPHFYRTGEVVGEGDFLITKSLAQNFTKPVRIAGQVGPFDYYYRPLSEYVNTLVQAGWRIKQIRDWFVDMERYSELVGDNVTTKIKRTDKVPLYTFIECENS